MAPLSTRWKSTLHMFQQEKINHCSEDTDRFKGFISALAVVHSGGRSTDCPVCEAHSFLLMCVQVLKALLLDTFRSNKAVETCVHSSCPYVVKISDQSLMIGPQGKADSRWYPSRFSGT